MMDWSSFFAGVGCALNVCGLVLWATVMRIRREDVAWRNEQRRRIDDLGLRSEQQYAQTRREMGLPPRSAS